MSEQGRRRTETQAIRHGIPLRAYLYDIFAGHPLSQDEIWQLTDMAQLIDAQYETDEESGRERLVRIFSACGYNVAVAPTYDTANLPRLQWTLDQPWEVIKVERKVTMDTCRWVPRKNVDVEEESSVEFPSGTRIALDERFSEEVSNEWCLCEWLGDRLFGDDPKFAECSVYGFYDEPGTGRLVLAVRSTDDDDGLGVTPFALYLVDVERNESGEASVVLRHLVSCDGHDGELDGYDRLSKMLSK